MKFQRIVLAMAYAMAILGIIAVESPRARAFDEVGFQRTLTVSGPVRLDVSSGSGYIRISKGESGKVQINARIRAKSWFGGSVQDRIHQIESNPPIQQDGNTIRIGHLDNIDMGRDISISYEITTPADSKLHSHTGSGEQTINGLQGPLEVESGSGDLKIDDIGNAVQAETGSGDATIRQVKGDLRIKTGSGSIRAVDIAGGLDAHTGSGSVDLEQTAPGSVRVSTGSGDIELRGIQGSLDAEAGSGGIRADGSPTGPWKLRTGSGEVHLKLAANAAFDLDARTSSGSVSVGVPITAQGATGKKEIHGQVRGGGTSMEIRTGSGDIEID
jgi:Putative adhesin